MTLRPPLSTRAPNPGRAPLFVRAAFGPALLLVVIFGMILVIDRLRPQLELGTGYAARVACGCRYIGGRSLASCRTDFEPGMEPIRLSDDPVTRSVTAWVPLIASRSASFDPLLGCQPNAFSGVPLKLRD